MIKPPAGAKADGKRLWSSILGEFELAEHEMALLRQAVYVADLCSELQAIVDVEGPLFTGPQGLKAHPALGELRAQRILLARLVVALRVPLGEEESGAGRTQRRGVRGVYGIR